MGRGVGSIPLDQEGLIIILNNLHESKISLMSSSKVINIILTFAILDGSTKECCFIQQILVPCPKS